MPVWCAGCAACGGCSITALWCGSRYAAVNGVSVAGLTAW